MEKITSFLKEWNKEEDSLIHFMSEHLNDEDIEFYEIERNCAWFMLDNNISEIDESDIKLLINRILTSE